MQRVGILVVSYGSREAAFIDLFTRSLNYRTEIYVVDKQRNPFNVKKAKEHLVVPDLNIEAVCEFAKKRKDKIDFGLVGPEKPIIEGVRNLVEKETHIPIICPTKEYAIEVSKVAQRNLFEKTVPQVNPKFRIFDPKIYKSVAAVRKDLYAWLDELENQVAVKPDRPTAGKGVGVWGDHFNNREELFEHFLSNYKYGTVIVEEKIDGEESSFQAFCDGRNLVPLPETRDNKRAFDDDKGPNTGGMGSYKGIGDTLPFMTTADRDKEIEIVNKIFKELRKTADKMDLRGIPFYEAFIHTGKVPKILENNSRPGDPEILNILPIIKDDFVDVCYKILEGNLTHINLEKQATVITYKVPANYGGYSSVFPDLVNTAKLNSPVDLSQAEKLATKHGANIRLYPGSMEIRDDGKAYALSSRTVGVVGISDNIPAAREISLEGVRAVQGGALWYRNDIASVQHIQKSIKHMEKLRLKKT
jgi:phosphoribosylamine--glycine ligase